MFSFFLMQRFLWISYKSLTTASMVHMAFAASRIWAHNALFICKYVKTPKMTVDTTKLTSIVCFANYLAKKNLAGKSRKAGTELGMRMKLKLQRHPTSARSEPSLQIWLADRFEDWREQSAADDRRTWGSHNVRNHNKYVSMQKHIKCVYRCCKNLPS